MNRRILAVTLIIVMFTSMITCFPTKASAASKNYDDANVHWLGDASEYADTIKTLFPEEYNGLRKVKYVADRSGQDKNGKWGLINKEGEYVAQPIYDEIKVISYITEHATTLETMTKAPLFENGYTQAKRDGKMGLLNTKGEEVVPCEYDYVGLPSEGVCRIVKDNKLGYYNIEKNKVIVKPKYEVKQFSAGNGDLRGTVLISKDSYVASANLVGDTSGTFKQIFDFNGGYALVPLEDEPYTVFKCDVIDKNGKSILPSKKGGYYTWIGGIHNAMGYSTYYPQVGPYLAFYEMSKKAFKFPWGGGKYCEEDGKNYLTGVVTKDKILVKAEFGKGLLGDKSHSFHGYQNAELIIIPQVKQFYGDKFKSYTVANDFNSSIYNLSGKKLYDLGNSNGSKNVEYLPGTKQVLVEGVLLDSKGKKITTGSFNTVTNDNYCIRNTTASDNNMASGYINGKSVVYDLKAKKVKYTAKSGSIVNTPNSASSLIIIHDKKEYKVVDYKTKDTIVKGAEKIDNHLHEEYSYLIYCKGGKYGLIGADGTILLKNIYSSISGTVDARYLIATDAETGESVLFDTKEKKKTEYVAKKGYSFSGDYNIDTVGVITVKSKVKGESSYMLNVNTGATLSLDGNYSLTFSNDVPSGTLWNKKQRTLTGSDLKVIFNESDYKVGQVTDSVFTVAWVTDGSRFGYINSAYLAHGSSAKKVGGDGNSEELTEAVSGDDAKKSETEKPDVIEGPTVYNTGIKDETITFSTSANRWSTKIEMEVGFNEDFSGSAPKEYTCKIEENRAHFTARILSKKNEYYYRMRFVLDDGTKSEWTTGTVKPSKCVNLHNDTDKAQIFVENLVSNKTGELSFSWKTQDVKTVVQYGIQIAKEEDIKNGKYPASTSFVDSKRTDHTQTGLTSGVTYVVRMYVSAGNNAKPSTCWSAWYPVVVK